MTPASFRSWRVRLYGERGQTAAAKALGCGRTSIQDWEKGYAIVVDYRDAQYKRSARKVPVYIALAAAALSAGLPPIP